MHGNRLLYVHSKSMEFLDFHKVQGGAWDSTAGRLPAGRPALAAAVSPYRLLIAWSTSPLLLRLPPFLSVWVWPVSLVPELLLLFALLFVVVVMVATLALFPPRSLSFGGVKVCGVRIVFVVVVTTCVGVVVVLSSECDFDLV